VSDKSHQCRLWWAIDHATGVVLAYCFGTREHKYFDELRALLAPFKLNIVYCDDNFAYKLRLSGCVVKTSKRNMQCIECKRLSLRTWCSRLVRRGICFLKSDVMHKTVVGLIINFWFFKRKLPCHLT
jgi:insertion element IS1 protein InsB